jgi:hypothetical protein
MNGEEGDKEGQEENIRQISQNITNKFGNHRLVASFSCVNSPVGAGTESCNAAPAINTYMKNTKL